MLAVNQCSPYITNAALNEVFFKKTGADRASFIEIKLLDSNQPNAISASIYNQWKIRICDGSNSCFTKALSFATEPPTGSTYPWLYVESPILDDSYINFYNGFDLALIDENDDYIDYIQVNNKSYQTVNCIKDEFAYVFDVPATQNGTKLLHRIPDGTGDWVVVNAAKINTPGDGNGYGFPYLVINDAVAVQGQNITFTVYLVDENGAPTTSNNIISFRYKTINGSAIGDTHFSNVDFTIAYIPADQTSITLPAISTVLIGDQVTRNFTLFIDGSSAANISDGFAQGTIQPLPNPVFSCDATFVDGATSHSSSGNVSFDDWSYIFDNPDGVLQSPTVTNFAPTSTCWGFGDCSASGSPTTPIDLGTFITTSSTERRDATIGSPITIGDDGINEYDFVNVEAGGSLTTSNAHSTYYMRGLYSAGSNAVINLAPGDYYIEYLTIGSGTLLYITEPGVVRLFVKSSIWIGSYSEFNHQADNDRQLHIASYDQIVVDTAVRVKGLIYSVSNTFINPSAHVYGAVSGSNVYLSTDARIYTQCISTAPKVDHYQIIHDGNGLTCEAETITIKACTNAFDGTCTQFTGETSLDLTLSGTSQTFTQSVPSFTNGATTINVNYVYPDEPVTLSVANTSIPANNGYVCNNDAPNDCIITFADSGFSFSTQPNSNALLTEQIAGKPSNLGFDASPLYLRAVEKNSETGACQAALTGTVEVELAAECENPLKCAGAQVDINGTNILTFDAGDNGLSGSLSTVNLNFGDANQEYAPFNLTYPDVGLLKLHAKYKLAEPDPNNAVNQYMTGESNSFVVRPFGFHMNIAPDSSGNTTNPKATDATGDKFKKAGENFEVIVTSMQWEDGDDDDLDGYPDSNAVLKNNFPTLNFGNEITPVNVELIHSLIAPDPITGEWGILSGGLYSAFSNGVKSQNINWNEVGVLSLTARIESNGDYLTGSVVNTTEPFVGRFTPDHFEISNVENGDIVNRNLCLGLTPKSYTYIGEMNNAVLTEGALIYGVEPEFLLTAKSSLLDSDGNATTTMNYSGDFNKLDNSRVFGVPTTKDGSKKGSDNGDLLIIANLDNVVNTETGNFTGEQIIRYSENDHFTYPREKNTQVAPFEADINLSITSIIDYDDIETKDYTSTDDLEFPNTILTLHPVGTNIRFGRWQINNAYGPETENLPVPMTIQQWDGSNFITNPDESCMVPASITNPEDKRAGAIWSSSMDDGQYRLFDLEITDALFIENTDATVAGSFDNGELMLAPNQFVFSAPNNRAQGALKFEYQVPSWLKYDWKEQDGSFDDNPTGLINFGLFRGNDRIISWREVGN